MNLSLAVAEAAKAFHARWRGLLGLEMNFDAPKEHWTRVKALTRRLAEGWTDQYDSLQPVADLRNQLQVQLYLMLQRPATPNSAGRRLTFKAGEGLPSPGHGLSLLTSTIGVPRSRRCASPDQNRFLKDVASLVAEVTGQFDVKLE